jgi:hypothetical protein
MAYFEEGQCENKVRSIEKNPTLVMPVDSDCTVEIFAAWANSFKVLAL